MTTGDKFVYRLTSGHVPAVVMLKRTLDGHNTQTQLGTGIAITLVAARSESKRHTKIITSVWSPTIVTFTLLADEEGLTWCRGWDNEAVNAMIVARALQ